MKLTLRTIALTMPLAVCNVVALVAQETKRPLDHSVYDGWNRISARAISNDGRWIFYRLTPGLGDSRLYVRNTQSDQEFEIPRGASAEFTYDSRFVVFQIEPVDSIVKDLRIEDTRSEDLPKDSLGVLELASGNVTRVERVKSFALPGEAGGWLAYLHEAPPDTSADSSDGGDRRRGGRRGQRGANGGEQDDEDEKEPGTQLVVRNISNGAEWSFEDVTVYKFAENGSRLAYAASNDSGDADGLYLVTPGTERAQALMIGEGIYKALAVADEGDQVAFLSNRDEFGATQPAFALYHWEQGREEAQSVADASTRGIPAGWWVSENGVTSFSENGKRIFFGSAPRPAPKPEEETPEWEKVELDVWNWKDPLLQPNQLVQRERELKRTYRAMVDLEQNRVLQLASVDMPTVMVADSGDGEIGVAVSNMAFRQQISWDSPGYNDVFVVEVTTGRATKVLEGIQASPRMSPGGKYVVWWDGHELAWFAKSTTGGDAVNLTGRIEVPFSNQLHDSPSIPGSNGSAGWTEDDELFLVYDKHDIWAVDPDGSDAPRNITEGVGRRDNLRFRYVSLDGAGGFGFGGGGTPQDVIDDGDDLVLSAFDFESKGSGFYRDRVRGNDEPQRLMMDQRRFRAPQKAKDADVVIYTRESFQEFPDLWTSDLSFRDPQRVSHANPQQADYLWGTAEITEWTSTDGRPLQGLLFKPENFDPSRKYPMMVYYYEKNSDNLHAHRAPAPGSSSINISLYVSRGYIVFVPDIFYRDGYPGESALNCVVPGVLSVIAKGYVDPDRVGAQGHSWGGYQNAYLVTRTNIFAAVEAGAPVSNMTSAYGGIRWQTGLSRAMQYERTQSRLGGSLWEARPRYIENSPIFWADKIETPVLMMHNDNDGAVPWYQGIEFFVALRRLHKPVWMLNYNGEPHGLRKYQNRKDFATRMLQFFDHYLQGTPAPVWMEDGVPAAAKGLTDGLSLVEVTPSTSGGNGR